MTGSIFLTGPKPSLKLVPNDIWLPGLYSRRVLCFELPQSSSQDKVVDIFQRALNALVQGTPELGATSIVVQNAALHDPSKPWRELATGKGIELVIKDLTASMPSFKQLESSGFPLSEFRDSEIMPIEGPIMPEPAAVSKFQLNFIEGGVLLSSCIYHHLTDGNGMNAIMRALAENCKKATETQGDLPPHVLDTSRAVFDVPEGLTDIHHHGAYSIGDDLFTPGVSHDEAPPEVNGVEPPSPPQFQPHYYHISAENAQAIKEYASSISPVSTHDAISAALWRNLIISRVSTGELTDLDKLCSFTIPHNARKYLNLPSTWVGNLTYFIIAYATVREITQPDSVPLLASRIRAAMSAVTPAHVHGVITLRKRHPFSLSWWPIMVAGEPEIVALTSFYHSELLLNNDSDGSPLVDWGEYLGHEAKHFTTTDLGAFAAQFQRAHFVGPKLPPDGRGCYVHIGLLKPEVESFRTEEVWNRYFTLKEVTVVEGASSE
ncbi:hypothetical protein CKM354_000803800 [Cercospora kikuchii]|uniref:Trichothecene 3-O-acetyltransferase-like N-terminal domain-containing protein n=1 Tax=Cercospora kikuchii TaxID=84275 RepID=A0A9P3FI03_9PEZI|nr:uncharacterized protein CKM354_000803800 [Cercospora kikuchii]GIZ44852.1 hypothetical protein CKM354_000803800 [Cercospora kikuchii]